MSVRFSISTFDAGRFVELHQPGDEPRAVFETLDDITGPILQEIDGIDPGAVYYTEEEDEAGSLFDALRYDLEYEEPDDATIRTIELLEKVGDNSGNLAGYDPLIGFLTADEVAKLQQLLSVLEVSDYIRETAIPPVQKVLREIRDTEFGLLLIGE